METWPMGIKILFVDDEPDLELLVRQKFRRQIRDGEYEFVFARNGVQALEKLHEDAEICIVLTDINMPEMDGLTLLMRLNECNELLKAVVISAYGDLGNIRTAMNRGAFDFLTKPIDFQDLEITMHKTLKIVAELRQAAQDHNQLVAIQREMDIARKLQQSILPKAFSPFSHAPLVDLHAVMVPAQDVGGDFYDFFFLDQNRLALVIADVCGKGVPASLFMMMSRTLLKSQAILGLSPSECLHQVNNYLCADNSAEMFVTLFYGIFDARTGTLEYSSGGHNPPFTIRNGGTVEVLPRRGGTALGVFENSTYQAGSITLAPNDSLILYTDGVTEAEDKSGAFYGTERFSTFLASMAGLPASRVTRAVLDDVHAFASGARQSDDITALALRFVPSS